MNRNITITNMMSGAALQFCSIASGFIIPKIILNNFGSEVNGLVSSLNQFLNYIALFEGGISGVIIAKLYNPLVSNDMKKVSEVLVSARHFYRKISIIFLFYSVLLALFFPLVFSSDHDFLYLFLLTIILSLSTLIQYCFSLTERCLLNAAKKNYVVNITNAIIIICNIILIILSVKIYPSIHFIKAIQGCLYIVQPLVFIPYIKRNYSINWKESLDKSLIKERWNGFAVNIASFIHNCTDIVILTIVTDLKTVSIYSVYALISNGLKTFIMACFSGIANTIGQSYAAGNISEVNKKMDLYEIIVFSFVTFFFTVAALLITPFVLLYTKHINDTNYYHPIFGVLLLLSEAIYLLKIPQVDLAYSADKFKEIKIPCFIEAAINILASLILVKKFRLVGVSLGTIIGMTYRMIFQVHFSNQLINRRDSLFYKKLILFGLVSIIGFSICQFTFPIKLVNVYTWITHAVIYSTVVFILILATVRCFYSKEFFMLVGYFKCVK